MTGYQNLVLCDQEFSHMKNFSTPVTRMKLLRSPIFLFYNQADISLIRMARLKTWPIWVGFYPIRAYEQKTNLIPQTSQSHSPGTYHEEDDKNRHSRECMQVKSLTKERQGEICLLLNIVHL